MTQSTLEEGTASLVVGLIFLCGVVPCMLVTMFLFMRLRAKQPIKGRGPWYIFSINLIILIYLGFTPSLFIADVNCYAVLFVNGGVIMGLGLCYIIRCLRLYFKFELTIEVTMQAQRGHGASISTGGGGGGHTRAPSRSSSFSNLDAVVDSKKGSTWYIRHRYLLGHKYSLMFFLAGYAITFLPLIIFAAVDGEPQRRPCVGRAASIYFIVWAVAFIVAFLLVANKLREVVEGFFIKRELRATCIIMLTCIIGYGIVRFGFPSIDEKTFPASQFIVNLAFVGTWLLSTVWPLKKAMDQGDDWAALLQEYDASESIGSLKGLLANKAGRKLFEEHLAREFSMENLIFWDTVETFRRKAIAPGTDVVKLAHAVYEKCVSDSAPYTVDLPSVQRNRLRVLFEGVTSSGEVVAFPVESPQRQQPLQPHDEDSKQANGSPSATAGADGGISRSTTASSSIHLLAIAPAGADPLAPSTEMPTRSREKSDSTGLARPSISSPPNRQARTNSGAMIDAHVFDEAQRCVYDVMNRDSYRRFMLTEAYKHYFEDVYEQQRQQNMRIDFSRIGKIPIPPVEVTEDHQSLKDVDSTSDTLTAVARIA